MKTKFLIVDFKGNKKIIECDEMVTGIIYDSKDIVTKFYKNKELTLDTKMTEDNYLKFSKILNNAKALDEIICLMLNDDNTFIEEIRIVNINQFKIDFDKILKKG